MEKLLRKILILKYKIRDRIKSLMIILFRLFGFDFEQHLKKVHHANSRRRLREAIREAENVHILNNGAKVYVFEETGRSGHYIVLTSSQAQRARIMGYFSTRSKHFDLNIEACHIIPGESYTKIKNKQMEEKTPFVWIVVYFLIGFMALFVIISQLIK